MNKLSVNLEDASSCDELGLDAVRGCAKSHEAASKFHYELLAAKNS
jgi:hypothetical protein